MLIRNGTIVTSAARTKGDILVRDEKIAGVRFQDESAWFDKGAFDRSLQDFFKVHGSTSPAPEQGNQDCIDASGCYVFAGGVDPHVHMHLPTSSGYSSDDFATGSRAALLGGTTTMIDFVTPKKEQNLIDALDQRKTEATGCCIDYSFHVSPVEWRDGISDEINEL